MISPSPLVSVIIPVYNHEAYIEEALHSVWKQSYPFIEIIVIDDGSQDQSCHAIEKVLETWQHENSSRQITFIKQENQGAHNTINRGLALSKGHFITILNSDDYYAPSRIEKMLQSLHEQNAEWAFTGVQGIDEKGQNLPLDHFWKVWYEKNVWSSCLHPTIGFQLLQDNLAVSTGNLFFSRSIYEKVGEFKNYKLAHDLDYALRALVHAEPLFIQEKLYFYRMHQTNTLHQVNHLVDQEKAIIYKNYLTQVVNTRPENPLAPCSWHWPLAFPKFRHDLGMDKALLNDLFKLDVKDPLNKQPSQKTKTSISKNGLFSNLGYQLLRKRSNKKITLITHTLCLSGAPKVVLDLAILLQKKGYKINILSIWDGPLRKEFEALNISVFCTEKWINWYTPRTKIKKAFCFLRLLFFTYFKVQKTVIGNCAVSWRLLFPLILTSPFKNFFWYIHDSFSPSFMIDSGLPMKIFQKIKQKSNLRFWFGSDSTRQIWKEAVEGEVKYWSGIPEQILPYKEKKSIKNILSVGSVSPRKAPHHLIDAFIYGVEQKIIPDDVTLTIIGFEEVEGDAYLYELLYKRNRAKNRIKFIKHVEANDLAPIYQDSDLYVQTSVVECLPLALLQAMSIGLPIITTDANGCVEAIEHLITGYVCPTRNIKTLTIMLAEAINNPVQSFQLGMNAQKKFNEMFSLEKTQEELLRQLEIFIR